MPHTQAVCREIMEQRERVMSTLNTIKSKARSNSQVSTLIDFLNATTAVTAEECQYINEIVVESLYKLHPNQDTLSLRQSLWSQHFGVPPLLHQLYNERVIDGFIEKISNKNDFALMDDYLLRALTGYQDFFQVKTENDFLAQFNEPDPDSSGKFIPTLNQQGYMTTDLLDEYSQRFIQIAKNVASTGGKVLEIGAAYGVATLKALNEGASIVCNDLSPEHLAVVERKHQQLGKGILQTVAGRFPNEFVFENDQFDAILICRVLHFFDGPELVNALRKAKAWLKPGGSLIIVNETPYMETWRSFVKDFKHKKVEGEKWPGVIRDTKKYEQHRVRTLPPLVHWLDHDSLQHAFLEAGFLADNIRISYINREGQFPPDMIMKDGLGESIGGIAERH